MKSKSQTLEESKEKIKKLINYDAERFITEQDAVDTTSTFDPTSTWGRRDNQASTEVGKTWFNAHVRRINKWMNNINQTMKSLEGKTHEGVDAAQALRAHYKDKYKQDLPQYISLGGQPAAQADKGQKTADGYKVVAGTPEDPYVYGTSGSGIKTVQQNLGFSGTDLDGKWGPNTQKALVAKVPDVKQFTNDELSGIVQKIRGTEPIAKAQVQPSQTNVASKVNTTQLAGQKQPQQNLAYNTNTTAVKGV